MPKYEVRAMRWKEQRINRSKSSTQRVSHRPPNYFVDEQNEVKKHCKKLQLFMLIFNNFLLLQRHQLFQKLRIMRLHGEHIDIDHVSA